MCQTDLLSNGEDGSYTINSRCVHYLACACSQINDSRFLCCVNDIIIAETHKHYVL